MFFLKPEKKRKIHILELCFTPTTACIAVPISHQTFWWTAQLVLSCCVNATQTLLIQYIIMLRTDDQFFMTGDPKQINNKYNADGHK